MHGNIKQSNGCRFATYDYYFSNSNYLTLLVQGKHCPFAGELSAEFQLVAKAFNFCTKLHCPSTKSRL